MDDGSPVVPDSPSVRWVPSVRDLPRRLRRLIRRRRRLVAATLAALAVLLLVSALRPAPPVVDAGTPTDPTSLLPGESRVPVTLASAAIAATLVEGDVVDLVTVDEVGAQVIAPHARVVSLGSGGSALTASSPVVVVAVPQGVALDVTAAAARGPLAVVIQAS